MCGRFSNVTVAEVADILEEVQREVDAREEAWGIEVADALTEDVRPGSMVAALFGDGVSLSPNALPWGLPASWATGKLLFNTRIEKAIGESGMWPSIAERYRCLVPATRFWERSREDKQVSFVDNRRHLIMMAGVHFDGRLSIVTTEPAPEVARFHDRMPLCLTPAMALTWLSPTWRETANGQGAPVVTEPSQTPAQLSLF